MTITCLINNHDILGEGPIWDHRIQRLYWLDIEQAKLQQLDPLTKAYQSWQLPDKPGAMALMQHGLLIALTKEFIFFDPANGTITSWIKPLTHQNEIVFNDGKCDRGGRFWIGSKDIKEKFPNGALYRLDPDGNFHIMDQGFIVSNGMDWSPDNCYFYFTDGDLHRQILRYDFDIATGAISNRQVFAKIAAENGYPDGLTVDSEGYVWGAHWDGWRITRYAPDGTIDRIIEMPVARATSCCFGGPNLDILFVTSATRGLSAEELKQSPQAGGLFAVETGIKGLSESLFINK